MGKNNHKLLWWEALSLLLILGMVVYLVGVILFSF